MRITGFRIAGEPVVSLRLGGVEIWRLGPKLPAIIARESAASPGHVEIIIGPEPTGAPAPEGYIYGWTRSHGEAIVDGDIDYTGTDGYILFDTPSPIETQIYVRVWMLEEGTLVEVDDYLAPLFTVAIEVDTPNPFDFSNTQNAERSTVYTSGWVQITGFSGSQTATVTGGEYQIADDAAGTNATAWSNAEGSILPGQYARVRGISSAIENTLVSITLSVGGTAGTFSITTETIADVAVLDDGDSSYTLSGGESGDPWSVEVVSGPWAGSIATYSEGAPPTIIGEPIVSHSGTTLTVLVPMLITGDEASLVMKIVWPDATEAPVTITESTETWDATGYEGQTVTISFVATDSLGSRTAEVQFAIPTGTWLPPIAVAGDGQVTLTSGGGAPTLTNPPNATAGDGQVTLSAG